MRNFKWIITIAFVVIGFFLLLRACLSRFDRRVAISATLIFEQKQQHILLSLFKHEKTIAYRQYQGVTRRSIKTSYYLQTNDAKTGKKINEKKIKSHDEIEQFPIEIIGATANIAWVFIGELMAFNPFSLEKLVDIEALESKNPSLKGKFPPERRFYQLDRNLGRVAFMATDGKSYSIDPHTMIITSAEAHGKNKNEHTIAEIEEKVQELDKKLLQLREEQKNYHHMYYYTKQISYNDFYETIEKLDAKSDLITKQKDSLKKVQQEYKRRKEKVETSQRQVEAYRNAGGINFRSIKLNCDTFKNRWYGIMSEQETINQKNNFRVNHPYDETSRSKLYEATYTVKNPSLVSPTISIEKPQVIPKSSIFIQGGFLVDVSTAEVLHLKNPDGYIVLHKDKIGADGHIIFTRVNLKGQPIWSINTTLNEIHQMNVNEQYLIVLGSDNKELMYSDNGLFISISLNDGKNVTYDYMEDEVRK